MKENLQASCEMNQESTAGHKSLNVESQTFHQTREQVQAYNHKILDSQVSVDEEEKSQPCQGGHRGTCIPAQQRLPGHVCALHPVDKITSEYE